MNTLHLRAFLWLRWRLFVNQMKKGGLANRIILGILAVGAILSMVACFVGAFIAGLFGVPRVSATVSLLIWDGIVVAFLFAWMIGLLNELQRSEVLTFEKFLHLPVSLSGVFFLNYLSSFLSVNLMFFGPLMIGLTLGAVLGQGPAMLLMLPLVLAFIFAVTALTYQFQGWLASLMVNKRRRRTIIMIVTLVFVLVCQIPNLINFMNLGKTDFTEQFTQVKKDKEALRREWDAKKMTKEEYWQKLQEIEQRPGQAGKQLWKSVEETAWVANMVLPPGWLPLGAATAHDGNVVPSLIATLGFALVGTASLWRAYRTVLRLYTGEYTASKAMARQPDPVATPAPSVAAARASAAQAGPTLLERAIPGISEHAAAVALAGFRSLLRAPEAKMLLLTPVFIVVIFGGMFWRGAWSETPPQAYPFIGGGAMTLILFTLIQIMGNQFGFDRSGFRIYVLCPAPRCDILLGKNLAIAPIVCLLVLPILIAMQIVMPLRIDHLLAMPLQFMAMFLLCAMWANTLSILAPMPIASGSLKPANPKGLMIMLQLFFAALLPVMLGPTFIPMGIETLLSALGVTEGLPIGFVLMLIECALVLVMYRHVLGWQGKWLEARELKILETVTTKAE